MALEPGRMLLHYRLEEKVGEGGMGVVWRAMDSTLGREAAIKILPDLLAKDAERLARFEREARLLASLNHPHIAVVHGLHQADGIHFLAMEMIPGQDLKAVLDRGLLGVDETLRIAVQVAEALEAAHESGVIHRDLKPANIRITAEGAVKVVDFGLAKALSPETASGPRDSSMSPTLTSAGTVAGMILGTAAYMSPEQARGKAVDRRADIWAFGALLFEMLTGRQAFAGESVSESLATILKGEPEWGRLPARVPPGLRRLMARCLEKDPRRRLRDMGDVRLALEDLLAGHGRDETLAAPGGAMRVGWTLVAAAAVGAAAVTAGVMRLLTPTPPAPVPVHLEAAIGGDLPLFSPQGSSVALSPDGKTLAYVTGLASDVSTVKLHLRPLDRLQSAVVTGSDLAYNPFFSPDGQWVGFATPTELKKVSTAGGTPLALCPVSLSRGATWGEGGTIVFAPSPAAGLVQVSAAGGTPSTLTTLGQGEASHRWPQFLPGGRTVLFTAYDSADRNAGRIEVVDVASGRRTVVHQGGTYARYAASGHVLFVNNGTLFAAPLDLGSFTLGSLPSPVLQDISMNGEGGAMYDLSRDGTLVYLTGKIADARHLLAWIDPQGEVEPVTEVLREYGTVRISPDDRRLVAEVTVEGNQDIWVFDLERSTQTRLTFDDGREFSPVWSPDGVFVYYAAGPLQKFGIYRKRADGSGEAEAVRADLGSDVLINPYGVSPDGRHLAYHDQSPGGDIWILSLEGTVEARRFFQSTSADGDPVFSPDGRWIAYDADDTGRWEVYVRPFPGPGGKWQISSEGGEFPRWSADGRQIFYKTRAGDIWSVDIEGRGDTLEAGRPRKVTSLPRGFPGDWDMTSDGGRFLFVQQRLEDGGGGPNLVKMAFNWLGEVERLLASTR